MGATGRFFLCGSFFADYDRYDVKNGMLFLHLEQQEGEYYILADEMLVCKLRLAGEHFAAYIDREARFVSLYLLAFDKLYPVGRMPLEIAEQNQAGSGSGSGGYGLELI